MRCSLEKIVVSVVMVVALGLVACGSDEDDVITPPDNIDDVTDADTIGTEERMLVDSV